MPDDTYAKDDTGVESFTSNAALVKAETTTQLDDNRLTARQGLGIKPPYNPDRLAAFLELNETHAAAVRKKSRYEVGFGFDVVTTGDTDPEDADDLQRATLEDYWYSRESTWQVGPAHRPEPSTPEQVQELARQDYHAIGWECLELLVNAEGVPVGMAHVPANTVRVRTPPDGPDADEFENRGYVQVRDGRKRYFGVAGDRYRGREAQVTGTEDDPTVRYTNDGSEDQPVFVDKDTGDVAVGSAEKLPNEPANELIFIRNPSPLADNYGIPDWISSLRTMTADEAAKDYNRDFFRNDTVPRQVLKVTGGELREESKRDLRKMLDGLREEDHRTVLLEVAKFIDDRDADVDIEFEPIGQGVSEEMSFEAFREKNEHEIAKAHEVPPIKIGVTDTSNRSNSDQQDLDFAIEVIQPEQHKHAEHIHQIVHQQAFGVTDWTIEYELRGADQPKAEAEVARRKITAVNGAVPVNRALQMVGLDPLPEDHPVDGDETLVAEVGKSPTPPPGGGPGNGDRHAHAPPPENKLGERAWDEVEAELVTKDPIESTQFDSSNLDEGLFDFGEQELFLSFQREDGPNSLYAYVDVPTSEWSSLVSAGSHGSYHYDNIRLTYPYVEITNFHSRLPEGPEPDPEDIPEGVPAGAD